MLHINLHSIDLLVRAHTLHAEEQVIELSVQLSLIHDIFIEILLIIFKARIIVLIDVFHWVIDIILLV